MYARSALFGIVAAAFCGMFILAPVDSTSLLRSNVVLAQEPVPTPTPPVIPPGPVPVVPPTPAFVADIDAPKQATTTFFVMVDTTIGAENAWTNIFPLVEGQPFKPRIVRLMTDNPKVKSEMWIFNDPPAGAYVFRLRSQFPSVDPPLDPILDVEAATIVTGLGPTPPTPPGPIDPDVPTPPDVTTGTRLAFLIRETSQRTVESGRMEIKLRSGPSADYLKAKGHSLVMLDINSVDESKSKPSPLLEKYRSQIAGMPLPVLVVADLTTGVLISKTSLPAAAKDTDVVDLVKKAGG